MPACATPSRCSSPSSGRAPRSRRLTRPARRASSSSKSCAADFLTYNLIAADGLTLEAAQQKTLTVFQPGYRFDALVVFPEPGIYCVIDAASPNAGSINEEGVDVGPRLMGFRDRRAGPERRAGRHRLSHAPAGDECPGGHAAGRQGRRDRRSQRRAQVHPVHPAPGRSPRAK
jgi:hypothetical protein